VPPRGNELSDDPAVLSQQLLDHFERRNALIRSVVDVDSAKAVADRYPAVTDRVNALEAKLRSRLLSDEERQTLDAQFKARLDEGRREWTKEFMRVAAIPGAYENMDPDLAPHADLTPFPTDGEGLLQDAIRSLTKALEAARQVQNAETARKFSGAYRAANARAAPAMAGVRRARKLGINDRNPPQIEELVKQQDVELARIGRIQGLHALFTRGEESPTAPAAASQAAGVRVAKLDLPPSATAFFGQHPDPLLVRLVDVKDHQDRETLDHLISASSPRLSNRLGTANGEILMSPVTDLEGFLAKLTFAEVAVDRTTRVVELRPRYPLPDLSEVAVEQLLPELESGDEQRVINAINRLNHIKPGKGRERIGEALLKLIPIERVRHSAVDGIRHGWLGHEQIARVQKMLPTIQDSGQREQLVIGISKLPDLDEETIGWISGFYPTEHGAVMECWRNIGPAAEPFVQEYLKHPKHEKRKDACKTLGRIGTEASIPLLEQMLSDSDRGVAEEAKKAIEEIKKPEEQREYFKRRAAE
jgi:hypothetical protein